MTTRSNPWNIYSSDPTNRGPSSSVNAISVGFVATAILVSLFLIMAIFEHLFFRSTTPHFASLEVGGGHPQKLKNLPRVPSTTYGSDFSVVMPGQVYPTYIAQPAPFPLPCQREGICFPPHHI